MNIKYILLGIFVLAASYEVKGGCDPAMEFECDNGNCVQGIFICTEGDNCGDGSDETDPCPECPLKFMACKSGEYFCVYGEWLCDGAWHCEDGSDERDEFGKCPPCPPGMFQCSNGKCTHPEWICDGEDDCGDNSDEVDPSNGGKCPPCPRGMFTCNTSGCLFPWDMCNDRRDCEDRSDEENCQCENKIKKPLNYERPSKQAQFNSSRLFARTFPERKHR